MRKFTKPTWLAIGWLSLMMFFAIFGWALPFKSWNFVYEDDLEVGLFSNGHILGTDSNGYDLFASIVAGTRMSISLRLRLLVLEALSEAFSGSLPRMCGAKSTQ